MNTFQQNTAATSVNDAVAAALTNVGALIAKTDGVTVDQKQLLNDALDQFLTRRCTYCGFPGHIAAHCWLYSQLYYECKLKGPASSIALAHYKVYKSANARKARLQAKHDAETSAETSFTATKIGKADAIQKLQS